MKVTIYFVRHGQTEFNLAGRMQGCCDSPLTEDGKKELEKTGEILRTLSLRHAYISPLGRTVETAEIVLRGMDIQKTYLDDVKEVCFGELEGRDIAEVKASVSECFEKDDFSKFGGEIGVQVQERGRQAARRIVSEAHDGDCVVIVSHGAFFSRFVEGLTGVNPRKGYENADRMYIPNGSIAQIEYEDGVYSLKCHPLTSEEWINKKK